MGLFGFFIDAILPPHYGPEGDSASNRNEFQKSFLEGKGGQWVGLTTLPPSYADCLLQPPARPLQGKRFVRVLVT
jgi:hypothetical protein